MTLCRGRLGKRALRCIALRRFLAAAPGKLIQHMVTLMAVFKINPPNPHQPAYYSYQYENHRYLTKRPSVVALPPEASVRVAKSQDNSVLRGFSRCRPCVRLPATAHH